MKLKNEIIVALCVNGGSNITANDLTPANGYKVIKFRRALSDAFKSITEAEKALLDEHNLTVGEKGAIEGKDEDKKVFVDLQKELYKDESEIDCKTIPFEDWCALKKENKVLSNPYFEDSLEGILWLAPEE